MKIVFDQYQRYKNAQLVINGWRKNGEKFRILEVGANEHRNLEHFLPEDEILYLDIQLSEEKLHDPQYILGDATAMDFEDNSFDIVVALDVFEHIFPDRREAFLSELNRVSKIGFVLGAPFQDKLDEVHRCEERISEAYRVLYGIEHLWLKEHIENGLPNLDAAEKILTRLNIRYEVFSHGSLDVWEKMMYMQIMADYDKNLSLYFSTVSEYYNEMLFVSDYADRSYRKFIIADKQKRGVKIEKKYAVNEKQIDFLNKMYIGLLENVKLNQLLRMGNETKLKRNLRKVEVYYDRGNGFSEEDKDSREIDGNLVFETLEIPEDPKMRRLRLDLVNAPALLQLNKLVITYGNGMRRQYSEEDLKGCMRGLKYVCGDMYIAENDDPRIIISNYRGIKTIQLEMEVFWIEKKVALFVEKLCEEQEKLYEELEENMRELNAAHEAAKGDLTAQLNSFKLEHENEKNEKMLALANVENLERHADALQQMYQAMQDSICWKMTAPVRYVGDIFSQHLISRAIQCVKDNGLSYTINLYKTGGYNKGDITAQIKEEKKEPVEPEYKGKIIDTFNVCKEEMQRQREYKFSQNIKFSVLVPLYNTDEQFLREMIESVQYQTYQNWELCLADGSDEEHDEVGKICKEYAEQDKRILYKKLTENKGISDNTNACMDMATGDYISLFDHDDILHPCVLFEVMHAIVDHNADYIYTDENTFEGRDITHIITRHCKPDFAIDNLRANNYICHFSTFKKSLLEKTGRFRHEYDGSQDHDMILRLTEQAENVYHIPKILYYWRSHAKSVAQDINAKTYAIDAAKRAVASHLERMGLEAEIYSTRAFPTIFQLDYKIKGEPRISIIIPNKDHVEDLSRCLRSILTKSTYKNYEIIVVENNSEEPETASYYKMLEHLDNVQVVKYMGIFNYSKINNFGRQYASGEYIVLLNNDTEVISSDWMEKLLMYAQRDDVGAVGAKLYFQDGTIQHAGIVLGLGADRTAGHIHYGVSHDNLGYMGKLCYAQDMSAVTAACLMIAARKYDEIAGLNEDFAVALNDVDFCLRLREKGYLNVFTPFAELYHYESKSRGLDSNSIGKKRERYEKEVKLFKDTWKDVLEAGDPYYNPNFSLDRADYFYVGEKN